MIGQNKLRAIFDSYSINTLPKSILIAGETGSGKHTIVNYLANKLELDIIQLTDKTTPEEIIEYQCSTIDRLYLLDIDNLSQKQQNIFLKFIEEPSNFVHLIIITHSVYGILETVLNRCIIFQMEPYTKEQLKEITGIDNNLAYYCCSTPGQLFNANINQLSELHSLCHTIVNKLNVAPYNNAMSIATKINWKEEYDKYDLDLFLNMLEKVAFDDFVETNSDQSFKIYQITNSYKQLKTKMEKKPLIEKFIFNFLTTLWEGVN